jgi:hypothetical protein
MSVKRYDSECPHSAEYTCDPMCVRGGGEYVLHSDYLTLQSELSAVRAELERLLPLAKLAVWALNDSRSEMTDVCGGDLQDMAVGLGLLVEVEVKGPCGEHCNCAEYYSFSEFPVKCLRYSESLQKFMTEQPPKGAEQ